MFCRIVDSFPIRQFPALRDCPICSKVMLKFSGAMYMMVLILLFYATQTTMVIMMSESIVVRFFKSATADMLQNNETVIKCLC